MARIFWLVILVAGLHARGEGIINPNPLSAQIEISQKTLAPGENFKLKIALDLADQHWAYADRFKLKVNPQNRLVFGPLKTFPTETFFDSISKKNKSGIRGQATIEVQTEVSPTTPLGDLPVEFELEYQACTKDYCLLPITLNLPFTFNIAVAGSSAQSFSLWNITDISEARARGGLALVFVLVFLAGVLTSFTPCIFPMIPITLAILGVRAQRATRMQSFLLSLVYVFGIAITYAVLGVAAAMTGSLFGQILGSPFAIAVISAMFVAMALSMFGLFELQPPRFVRDRLSRYKTKAGYGGAFVSGIIAGVVASPCVGPVLVSILTFVATTKNMGLGFSLLFVFALGLGQIFIVLGTSSSLLQKLHKSGPWMVRIKHIFGAIMLAMAVYYSQPLWPRKVSSSSAQSIDWKKYEARLVERAIQERKPIIIDFWATWCAACFELEDHTFSKSEIRELSRKFLMLKYDATETSPELKKLQDQYKILGLPHMVFYDSSGKERPDLTLTGFEKAEPFEARMRKALNP